MVSVKQFSVIVTAFLSTATAAPTSSSGSGNTIPNKYVVVLKPGLSTEDRDSHIAWVQSQSILASVERAFGGNYDFNGYAGTFDDSTVSKIRSDPKV